MEIKRPFSEADWLATPKPVREYIEFLEQKVIELCQLVDHLQAHQKLLEKRVDDLESRLNRNSSNSSKPPSSDPPYQKPGKEAVKEKKERRRKGGQKGHKGHRQEFLEPSRVIDLKPTACPCGNHRLPAASLKPFYTHQVLELPEIQMDVTHYILHRTECDQCGRTVKTALPKHVRSGYGPRLTALIAEMSGIMGCSRETVQKFCASALGFHISSGAIQKALDRASTALEPIHQEIGRQIRQAEINHVDETSFFQNGNKLQWLWVLVNTSLAFFMIHAKRSQAAFQELIQNWNGILISDDYGVYRKWFKKQPCLAHLIRRAKGLLLKKDEQIKTFGQKTWEELQLLCYWAKPPPDLDQELEWIYRFAKLLSDHLDRKDDAGKFARQLARQLESLWLFLDEHGVEPTNNRAERALRYAVLWRKRSYGTQSEKGDRWVERILTLKETCRLRSVSTFQILTHAIDSFFKEQNPDIDWLIEN